MSALPTLHLTTGMAYEQAVRSRLAEARTNLRHAEEVRERFEPTPLSENWHRLCVERVRDALALCAEFGVRA